MYDVVVQTIRSYMAENGLPEKPISPDTEIMQGLGLDSLALAVVVVELEDKTGKDPFADGFINFRTVQELANLYA